MVDNNCYNCLTYKKLKNQCFINLNFSSINTFCIMWSCTEQVHAPLSKGIVCIITFCCLFSYSTHTSCLVVSKWPEIHQVSASEIDSPIQLFPNAINVCLYWGVKTIYLPTHNVPSEFWSTAHPLYFLVSHWGWGSSLYHYTMFSTRCSSLCWMVFKLGFYVPHA